MKYRLHLLLLFAIIFLPLFSEANEDLRPEIYVEDSTYDAGKVMKGTMIEHAFTFYNRGGEVLNIKAIKPGCNCSVAGDYDKAVPPGGEGKINIKINTTNLEGRRKKYVKVYSDDPVKKIVYLQILANITPYIGISSKRIVLRGLNGEVKTKEVSITGNLEKPLKIEVVSFDLEGKVHYEIDAINEGRQYIVRFENIPDVEGSHKGYLRMKTNYPENPDIKIRISSRFK